MNQLNHFPKIVINKLKSVHSCGVAPFQTFVDSLSIIRGSSEFECETQDVCTNFLIFAIQQRKM